jgi:vitamin B12 transporter
MGNPLLNPEENLGWDAGLDYGSPELGLKASAVYYSNDFENMIQYNFMTFTFDNIGAANSDGVEITLAYEPPEQKYSLSANVTTVSAEDSSGTELLRRPHVVTYATAGWKFTPKFKLGLALYDVGKWQDLDETYATITMKGYTRYDAFAEWQAVQNVTIFAKCENLENKLYQPIYSFPVPGRIYTVGLKATVEF